MPAEPYFSHRSCYVNFAEHLQNRWVPNLFFPDAPNRWSATDWRGFLGMIKAFGFTCFEYWVSPTLFDRPALERGGIYAEFAVAMRGVAEIAHSLGLQIKYISELNTIGPDWYFACPHLPEDKQLILDLWRHWARELAGADIVGLFPGDPGGCNRHGCTHETAIELALEVIDVVTAENPGARFELGTWGTPFSGWGADLLEVPGWDGSWQMLLDAGARTEQCHIWNGKPERARQAFDYLLTRLPAFPADAMVAINLGLDPDGNATMGGDARAYARAIGEVRPVTTWDYSAAEGELICYPHWRLPRLLARRREERAAAPYIGGMSYTMTPKLNLLSLYAAGQGFLDPDTDPDLVSRAFCRQVFGPEHEMLGELFEAFEVVPGWGHVPRRQWSREVLRAVYHEITERLEAADMSQCALPLFPDPETYRQDLLWFARKFEEMAGPQPDRERIRREYWDNALAIYDVIRMSADPRAEMAARQFSEILRSADL